jgi:transcription-repair coupling factor (superfamily II helicase)
MLLTQLKKYTSPNTRFESITLESISQKFKESPARITGLWGGSKAFLIAHLFETLHVSTLVVAPEEDEAEGLSQDLTFLLNENDSPASFDMSKPGGGREDRSYKIREKSQKVYYLPPREEIEDSKDFVSSEIEELRITALHSLNKGGSRDNPASPSIIVTSSRSLEQKIIPPEVLRIEKKGVLSRDRFVSQLAEMGFERVSTVQVFGEMSVRGGILDIFPFQAEYPFRIEFMGEHVETIRTFDPITQRSLQSIDSIQILPFLEKVVSSPDSEMENEFESGSALLDCLPEESLLLETEDDKIWTLERPNREGSDGEKCQSEFDFGIKSIPPYFGNLTHFRNQIDGWAENGLTPILLAENDWERSRLLEIFHPDSGLNILIGVLREGFLWEEMGIVLLTTYELYGRIRKSRGAARREPADGIPIEDLLSLRPRDFVVHVDYGIGQFMGVEKVVVGATRMGQSYTTDCLLIRYAEGDKVLVPIERMHRVQRYVGSSENPPRLTRLGTGQWERVKKRVKSSIIEMTDELIKLYAVRKSENGFSFSDDTPWQKELEASFPYEETMDQIKAVEMIKEDMESKKCMDRLVCGEVGYGKTEVALRAAFKAVMDHKQVAMLVPTTILADQHIKTFQNRLVRFPIRTEVLSRFKSPKEQKEIIQDLEVGKVDVLIGTHRLLSKDLKFKDLGLLIIDEEHRFGVKQKEKIKEMKKTVDCLALSATPIPRSLYMSLSGLRDIVTLSTPPQGRLAVHTDISTWDDDLLVRTIEKEVGRGGQVFFVHNRIETLNTIAQTLNSLLPQTPISIAHGQMNERELERVILNFISGITSVFVTTAIIEAGMDFPNANTIIINRADRFGLAQLHQLRGRVGRSKQKGYCYLLVPRRITQEARKRLAAIRSYTELGSGYKLALRDLEIRGAGNLLGPQQHGHVARVGFDLYCRLLEEAVKEIKVGAGLKPVTTEEREVTLQLDEEARIPEEYVEDSYQKVALYKRLLDLHNVDGLRDIEEEMRDRFGPLPKPCQTLFQTVALRILARKAMVQTITIRGRKVEMDFYPEWKWTRKGIEDLVRETHFSIEFYRVKGFGIRFQTDKVDRYKKAKTLLETIVSLPLERSDNV